MKAFALIPAHNEADRIGEVVREVSGFVDHVVVVDDGSEDRTGEEAREAGAEVLTHDENRGYLQALRTGFQNVESDVIVTLDADGEMDPGYIPDLIRPVAEGNVDLVLGRRKSVPRISERFLSLLAGLSTDVSDTGSGYRALRTDLARKMDLKGVCPCGTFVLEAEKLGSETIEVPVETRRVEGSRKIAWRHFVQFWHVLKALIWDKTLNG